MQSLLRWSIEKAGDQSTSNEGASQQPTGPKELDTGVLDVIMGRPESELMKEALAVAVDSEKTEDDRLQALDDFEMVSKCSSIPGFGLHILKSVFTIIAHRKH